MRILDRRSLSFLLTLVLTGGCQCDEGATGHAPGIDGETIATETDPLPTPLIEPATPKSTQADDSYSAPTLGVTKTVPVASLPPEGLEIVAKLCDDALFSLLFSIDRGGSRDFYAAPIHTAVQEGAPFGQSKHTFYMYPAHLAATSDKSPQPPQQFVQLSAPLTLDAYHLAISVPKELNRLSLKQTLPFELSQLTDCLGKSITISKQ